MTGFGDGGIGLDGWKSDDTRNSAGTNLIGQNTHAAVAPSGAGHDAIIANQIDWVTDFLGTRGNLGGLRFDGTSSGSGKSTLSVIDANSPNRLGLAGVLDDPGFALNYRWRKEDSLAAAGVSVKIGIQSANWGSGEVNRRRVSVPSDPVKRSGTLFWSMTRRITTQPAPLRSNKGRPTTRRSRQRRGNGSCLIRRAIPTSTPPLRRFPGIQILPIAAKR